MVVPWNSQLFLSAVKIGPALAAGCTMVVKASEDGPAPLLRICPAGAMRRVFPPVSSKHRHRLRPIMRRGGSCRHPQVDSHSLHWRAETGAHIVRNSAENLASTSLELGGKSPFIVFADADLESAANARSLGSLPRPGRAAWPVHG